MDENGLTKLTELSPLNDPTKSATDQAKFMIISVIIFALLMVGAIVLLVINRRKKS